MTELNKWLKENQISQATIAKKIRAQPATISMFVNGRQMMGKERIEKFCQFVGMTKKRVLKMIGYTNE